MKKVIFGGIAAVVVIGVAVAIYYVLSNLNALVAEAIEEHGSNATETRVSVSGVDISLREGRGSISGLRVANPDGFNARDAFSLGDITVDIDLGSVREDPVIIEEVRIRQPEVNVEFTEAGKSNLDELRGRIDTGGGGSGESSGGSAKNIRIKKFVFESGRVEVDATALGIDKQTVDLPEIYLENVGGRNGAPPDQIAKLILGEVARQVTSEMANSQVNKLIEDQLGGSLTDKAKGLLDKIGN